MSVRKIVLFFAIIIIFLSGGGVYYLYHIQTIQTPIWVAKQDIVPGTLISKDLLVTKNVLSRDIPVDIIQNSQIGTIYASKYIYSGDSIINSKVGNQPTEYKKADDRVIAIKPSDLGIMGIIQPNDRVTIIAGSIVIPNCRVIGITDSAGNIVRAIPQLYVSSTGGSVLQSIISNQDPNQPTQKKGADHLLILTSQQNAQLMSQVGKDGLSVIFENHSDKAGE